MTEKYFIVNNKSDLYKEYMGYKKNLKQMREIAIKFLEEHDIEANEYSYNSLVFYIIPTEKDKEKFKTVLGKTVENGTKPFKKNSKIGKAWINTLKENNIEPLHKPIVGWFFKNHVGKMRSRLFDINEIVYCSYKVEGDINTPEGFTEIKASEFWKIIEDNKANK